MATFLSKQWFKEELSALRERTSTWPMPWQVKILNSLLYLREDSHGYPLCVYRRTDNQLILSMTDTGDVYLCHHGFWEADFAFAVAEALVLLVRIHQERMRAYQVRDTVSDDSARRLALPRYPQLERSPNLEAFFDIVDGTSAAIATGKISADLWAGSRERFVDSIRWANEFEREHVHTVWDDGTDDSDYIISIDRFTMAKLEELAATADPKG